MIFLNSILKFFLVVLFSFCVIEYTFAQSFTNSPYSSDGFGNSIATNTTENIGLGKYGTSFSSPFSLNLNNPASYKSLVFTTFQASAFFSSDRQYYNDSSRNSLNGNFNFGSLAFPINKWIGAGFGFSPFSSFGYDIKKTNVSYGNQFADISYFGDGAINKAFAGVGINPFKIFSDSILPNFSIGVSPSFLFGRSTRASTTNFLGTDTSGLYINQSLKENNYRGMAMVYGLQNKFKLNKNINLQVGFSYENKINLKDEENFLSGTTNGSSGILLVLADSISKNLVIPASFSAGFGIVLKESVSVFFDYKTQDFSSVKYLQENFSGNLNQIYSLGIQYLPKPDLKGNVLERSVYRLGGYSSNGSYKINNVSVPEIGLSVGFGLSAKYQSPPMLNLAFEYIQRGNTGRDFLLEKFYRINVGITINDRWFLKRKID
jgi:hypothetical protein